MAQGSFVSYLRVSTQKQGQSGLGLEAQRKAVEDYLNGGDWNLIEELVEIESGKNNRRPKLNEAINLCKASGATLVVAKIDRLTRDAAFLLSLKDAGIDFIAADMPEANRLTIGIMALVAEQEREAISKRTKDALAAAKARGVQLGAYRGDKFVGRTGTAEDAKKASEARTALYRRRAVERLPMLQKIDPNSSLSLRSIAERLNQMNVPTISGKGNWSANSVRRLKAMSWPDHVIGNDEVSGTILFLFSAIKSHRSAGATYREIAEHLNQLKVTTARGGSWFASTVRNYDLRVT